MEGRMTEDSSETRRAAARRYMATKPLVEPLLAQLVSQMDSVDPDLRSRYEQAWRARADAIEAILEDAEATLYTVAELEALARFWGSPEGRAIQRKGAQEMVMVFNRLQPLIEAVNDEVLGPGV
jgi:hypothetical protein